MYLMTSSQHERYKQEEARRKAEQAKAEAERARMRLRDRRGLGQAAPTDWATAGARTIFEQFQALVASGQADPITGLLISAPPPAVVPPSPVGPPPAPIAQTPPAPTIVPLVTSPPTSLVAPATTTTSLTSLFSGDMLGVPMWIWWTAGGVLVLLVVMKRKK